MLDIERKLSEKCTHDEAGAHRAKNKDDVCKRVGGDQDTNICALRDSAFGTDDMSCAMNSMGELLIGDNSLR